MIITFRRTKRRAAELTAGAIALALLPCSGQRPGPRQDGAAAVVDDAPCHDGCESKLWPRLIVGVRAPPDWQGTAADLVHVRVRDDTGTVLEGNRYGCPDAGGIICTYSFFTTQRDTEVLLIVEPSRDGAPPAQERISLGRFNHCGRDIAYVVVATRPGSMPKILSRTLVSPCDRATSTNFAGTPSDTALLSNRVIAPRAKSRSG